MSGNVEHRHIVYVKNGDVIEQYERMQKASALELQGGPDAFLASFIETFSSDAVTLLSACSREADLQVNSLLSLKTLRRRSGLLAGLVSRATVFLRLVTFLRKADPDGIVCGSTGELLWACAFYARLTNTQLLHSRHNKLEPTTWSFRRWLITAIDKFAMLRADWVLCHGPFLREEVVSAGYADERILEFDVRLVEFEKNASGACSPGASGNTDPQRRTVLYSGRVERLKGVFDLLEALCPRLSSGDDTMLVFAGNGSASAELEQEISRLGIDGTVTLLGRVPHRDLAALMKSSRVVVTPSKSRFAEGRCMVAMESLAVGTPVIAPNYGPFPYLIEHMRNGLLFEPDSIVELRKCLDMILDDEDLYSKLRRGAFTTGQELLEPDLTFGQAVSHAFDASRVCRHAT